MSSMDFHYTSVKTIIAVPSEIRYTEVIAPTLAALLPVGIPEIAERLGVQRATVDIWRHRGLLPEPKWTVGGRPAWEWKDVEKWAKKTGRIRE